MASSHPLQGPELVDCAKSNAPQGLATAATNCGYGDDQERFLTALRGACKDLGMSQIQQLDDLITGQQRVKKAGGREIAPETAHRL
jgi:hypothetical protein